MVNLKGWVRTKRGNKNVAFIALNDGSIIHNIQIVVDLAGFDEQTMKLITTGACISVNGLLVESPGQGQAVEIQAKEIEVYGTADAETYPLQKKVIHWSFARNCSPQAPYQHIRCCFAYPSCHGICHS